MTYNKRFPEIWQIITKDINFKDKVVIDVGCGGGDLVKAAYDIGAKKIYGFDTDIDNSILRFGSNVPANVFLCEDDINEWDSEWPQIYRGKSQDSRCKKRILTCFSVLPYLVEPDRLVRLFREMAHIVLIEMQYIGDGPGQLIRNDGEMFIWLKQQGFDTIENIGRTYIEDRDKYRTIWRCE